VARPVISLAINAKGTVKIGSPIVIGVILTNTSRHKIVVERQVRGTDCQVDVRDMSGKLAPDTRFGLIYNGHVSISDMSQISPHDLNNATVNIPVKAGKTWTWGLDVGRFYDMSKPGKYLIYIRMLDPENPSLPWVKSNAIIVEMIP
jgi:hypothetical protein